MFGDAPLMRLVAGHTIVAQGLKVEGVLAPLHSQPVAPDASVAGSLVGIVNLMAGFAPEGLMRRRQPLTLKDRGFLWVAVQAFLVLWQQTSRQETMAGRTGEVLHFDRQVFPLGMAVHAEGLIRSKLMQFDGMAGGAFNAAFEPVQRMAPGLGNLGCPILAAQMAGEAQRTGNDGDAANRCRKVILALQIIAGFWRHFSPTVAAGHQARSARLCAERREDPEYVDDQREVGQR